LKQGSGLETIWDIWCLNGYVGATNSQEFVDFLLDAQIVDSYIADATRTESRLEGGSEDHDAKLRLLHAGMGFVTEAGEFMDALKKYNFYNAPLDLDNLDEEVGDLLWYIAVYLDTRGKSFSDIMAANIRKLKARYPEKFTSKDALNRNLDAEREAMTKE
jgi:NTP pyrophosphatase (non-canonical NTP hydrolase)